MRTEQRPLLTIAVVILVMFYRLYVALQLWQWFALPHGAPEIHPAAMFMAVHLLPLVGGAATGTIMARLNATHPPIAYEGLAVCAAAVGKITAVWVTGAIAQLFMP